MTYKIEYNVKVDELQVHIQCNFATKKEAEDFRKEISENESMSEISEILS